MLANINHFLEIELYNFAVVIQSAVVYDEWVFSDLGRVFDVIGGVKRIKPTYTLSQVLQNINDWFKLYKIFIQV